MTDDRQFALVVRFKAKDAAAAARFDEATSAMLDQMALDPHERGTLVYTTHTVPDEETVRVFYEVYANRDAWRAHTATAHFLAFRSAIEPLMAHWGVVSDLETAEDLNGRPTPA